MSNDGPSASGPVVLFILWRFVKFALLSVVTFFLLLTVLSLLFPEDTRVVRVINVAASRQRVIAAVSDFHTWGEWNHFLQAPLTNIKYSSPSAGTGAWLRTDQMAISVLAADSNGVKFNWDLTGGKQFRGGMQFLPSFSADSLTVQWWFDLHFRWYPWEKFGVFVYDRKLGPVMEESLKGLKQFVEKPL
jgi:hypothetical protein